MPAVSQRTYASLVPLKLQQSRAINELATALYSFLPGAANSTVSFEGVAETAGVARHWKGGSKRPAIADLLADTLERNPTRFCNLIVEIVRGGLKYRAHDPISREEMDHVNRIVADIGFKIPELNEQRFLRSLVSTSASETSSISAEALLGIEKKLRELTQLAPVKRGFAFEHLLNEMFALSGLAPRGAFRLIGEQIDGSFQLGDTTYLLEAKWQNAPLDKKSFWCCLGRSVAKLNGHGVCWSAFPVSAKTDSLRSSVASGRTSSVLTGLISANCYGAISTCA
jgi:hypothetical protein